MHIFIDGMWIQRFKIKKNNKKKHALNRKSVLKEAKKLQATVNSKMSDNSRVNVI